MRLIDVLPSYDVNHQVDKLLDVARMLSDSTSYIPKLVAVPPLDESAIGGRLSVEDQVHLEPGSLIVGFNGYSSQPEGFEFQIYDDGTRTYLGKLKFIKDRLLAAFRQGRPNGQGLLPTPYVVVGQLTVQITNLSSSTAQIQLLIHAASPRTTFAINQPEVRR